MDDNGIVFLSGSPGDTVGFGEKIGACLEGGEVVCLIGQLGSGKTHLIKGIACGVGFSDSDEVNSPTFVLVNEYVGADMRLEVYHIDAYRLGSVDEFEMLGFDDLCHGGSSLHLRRVRPFGAAAREVRSSPPGSTTEHRTQEQRGTAPPLHRDHTSTTPSRS